MKLDKFYMIYKYYRTTFGRGKIITRKKYIGGFLDKEKAENFIEENEGYHISEMVNMEGED